MLILLEGNDLTGKSTLAKAIAKKAHLKYKHLGPPGDVESHAHHTDFVHEWIRSPLGMVLDRGHWSGRVYADFHPDNALSLQGCLAIERIFRAMGGIVVYCEATTEEILGRWHRGEEFITPDDVEWINMAYAHLLKAGLQPDVRYRIGVDDMEETMQRAIAIAQLRSKK